MENNRKSKLLLFYGIVIFIVFQSCKQSNNKTENAASIEKVTQSITKTSKAIISAGNNDTLTVDSTCAIFISADSNQIDKRKKEIGEESFYVGTDDYMYYMSQSRDFLDSVKMKMVDCNQKKFLKLVYANNKKEIINLTNLRELWSVYFFDPNKKYKVIDMTNVEAEYNAYFKKDL